MESLVIRRTLGFVLGVQIKEFYREMLGRVLSDTISGYVDILVDIKRGELQ